MSIKVIDNWKPYEGKRLLIKAVGNRSLMHREPCECEVIEVSPSGMPKFKWADGYESWHATYEYVIVDI